MTCLPLGPQQVYLQKWARPGESAAMSPPSHAPSMPPRPLGLPRPRATPPRGLSYLLLDLGLGPRLCAQQSLLLQLFLQLRLLFPESGCRNGEVKDQRPGEGYQLLPTQPQASAPHLPAGSGPGWLGGPGSGLISRWKAQVPGFPSLVTDASPPLKAQAPARSVVRSPPVCT